MSITSYNGGAVVAMVGKDCVGIASDYRLGIQYQMLATDFSKVFRLAPMLYVGLAGLATDVQTLHHLLDFRRNLYELHEERELSPPVLASILSHLLYERRFAPYFIEPIIAGLVVEEDDSEKGSKTSSEGLTSAAAATTITTTPPQAPPSSSSKGTKGVRPYLATMDLIGCVETETKDFVVSGTCTGNLYGMCESLYRPNQSPDELFETLAQTLLSAADRDAICGFGGVVHIITRDGVITRELKGRAD